MPANPFDAYDAETRRLTREFQDNVRSLAETMLPEIQAYMTREIVRLFKMLPGFEEFYFAVPLREWMRFIRDESHMRPKKRFPQLEAFTIHEDYMQALRYLYRLHHDHVYIGLLLEDYEYGSRGAIQTIHS